ncbi:universal stress protein [Streptomyces sp. NBC_01264]|uniref:universal stress protein n=1 Tax=Streptomyces sp. NBC_01264 TaxID=2903804 RepID=UPI0022502570|nr:universal stress protein [Streptomyces sp. NBC_01264]MCX4781680.1 universal stress protein [Streptomyces sp. NBC_01264]
MIHHAYGRVIVGVSGSTGSITALHRAVSEARRLDAEVLAVLATTPDIHTADHIATERTMAERMLTSVLESAFGAGGRPPGVRFSALAALGGAGPVLTRIADRDDDLLIVGAPRRRILPGFSTARYCTTHATCPVLVVPLPVLRKQLGTAPLHTSEF